MKKAERAYASLRERIRTEWVLYLLAFVFILIADSIGQIKIPVWKGTFIIFPIFYALFLGILTGPNVLKILDDKKVKAASGLVGVAILPFVAKLGINAGANISIVISAGPALLLQELGNLCTIFLAMPIALLLGLKREAVGATHSINRETNLALMQDMFGADSPEAQGSLSVYIVGGMVGTIYFGFMASMAAATGLFHPYALGMASGVGAGILMKRFSSMMAGFGCPLYDPQQGVRFDKIAVFLVDEAGKYKEQAEQSFSRLLPRLEITIQTVSWDEYARRSKTLPHIQYAATIHRAKTLTKVTSFMQFGSAWANRPCQCKTAQLADKNHARRLLGELLQKSIERVIHDFLERTCYE